MYPLKFKPHIKEYIWGGHNLLEVKKGQYSRLDPTKPYGESWDISSYKGVVSVVANGMLKGNNLNEIIEVYMGDLVGDKIFERFGLEFPLIVKYLDCLQNLSVQVHPDDQIAYERHKSYGKTEMWYVVAAEKGAKMYLGFKDPDITREQYIEAVAAGTVADILQDVEVKAGDAFFIPAGTVHALGAGLQIVEIQQLSDITYRIFDWNRVDAEGHSRQLHTAEAIDVIDFASNAQTCRRTYAPTTNAPTQIVKCDYFTTNFLRIDSAAEMDYCRLDSFVIYVCLRGEVKIQTDGGNETIHAGEVVLIPAEINEVQLEGTADLLECYIG